MANKQRKYYTGGSKKGRKVNRSAEGIRLGSVKVLGSTYRKIEHEIKTEIFEKAQKAKRVVLLDTKEFIHRMITKTPVYKAMANPSGQLGQDIMAEFGVRPEEARKALDIMLYVLMETVKVRLDGSSRSRKNRQTFAVSFVVSALNREDYYNKLTKRRPFFYTARPVLENPIRAKKAFVTRRYAEEAIKQRSNKQSEYFKKEYARSRKPIRADWMLWVLNANRGIETMRSSKGFSDLKSFGIIYKLTNRNRSYSRSGRALMLKGKIESQIGLKSHGAIQTDGSIKQSGVSKVNQRAVAKGRHMEFPYKFPSVLRNNRGGRNFIEGLIRSKAFELLFIRTVQASASKVLKRV